MAFGRGKDDEQRPQRRKFQMRQKMMSIGDDYWIEDEQGNKAFRVDGKAMRMRDTWVLEDASGKEVATIREKKLTIRDKIKIELASGREATVKKEMISFRDKYHVDIDGADLTVKGDIADHEYKIERDGDKIAEISKKWFRVRETYGVEVADDRDTALILAVTVAVDAMSGIGK
ncbi:MAG TPA: LURP-one-related family protein [Acidimicrobiia bacterium]|nr:LURP-one-related family protein [Acidimicrobiia bacterium]